MWNALIVVWRESLEAMLVVGVLLSWIGRQEAAETPSLRRGLWSGVAAGVALAAALGGATWAAQSEFAGAALEKFQLAMVLVAAGLILHMVLWMHRHGRAMKRELERRAERSMGAVGLAAIAALAVGREGAETVVFLYGLGMEGAAAQLLAGAGAGFALAAATGWLVWRGARFLDVRTLLRASEFLLLLIATSLLADGRGLGRFLADFTGYRARPAATLVLAIAAFWAYALWKMRRDDGKTVHG